MRKHMARLSIHGTNTTTQVLGMAIIVVFCMGLLKLWWTNRAVRRHEILDIEKRARLTEMRKTGLSSKRGGDIPFGIRAIQSGIEVDGIWISRPASANRASSKLEMSTTTTLIGDFDGQKGKDRRKHLSEEAKLDSRPNSSSTAGKPVPWRTTSDYSNLEGHMASDVASNKSMPLPQISEDPPQLDLNRNTSPLNEDALLQLEDQHGYRPSINAYVPSRYSSQHSSIQRNYYRPTRRSSASVSSSSSISSDSSHSQGAVQPRSDPSSRNSSSSGRGYRSYASRRSHEPRPVPASPSQSSPDKSSFESAASPTSPRAEQSWQQKSNSQASRHGLYQPVAMPQPTFGPGDNYAHMNRTSRKVNSGFEVLPAGTFGYPQQPLSPNSDGSQDADLENEATAREQRKLQKKNSRTALAGAP